MRKLPPLAAVRVFEAAARLENFTAAANELGMTQAAVSYQVKALEERIGAPLFIRERGRARLTPIGARLAPALAQAFDTIEGAFANVRVDDQSLLTIATTVTFASAWLAWRIGAFQVAHPNLAVRLLTSDGLTDFGRDEVDVAIRAGRGDWAPLDAERLMKIDFTPMCSPGFLARHGGMIRAKDLPGLPLISPLDQWWEVWLRQAGVEPPGEGAPRGIRLDSQATEGAAAMAGQGVAMLTPFFWRNDIAEGRLVRLFEQTSSHGYGYWLVCPAERRNVPKIKRFREWLHAAVARAEGAPVSA